jgi:hypothetical protein
VQEPAGGLPLVPQPQQTSKNATIAGEAHERTAATTQEGKDHQRATLR